MSIYICTNTPNPFFKQNLTKKPVILNTKTNILYDGE